MSINVQLVKLSDLSFSAAFVLYVLALILILFEFSNSGKIKSPAPARSDNQPGKINLPNNKILKLGQVGYNIGVVGWVLSVTALVLRGIATQRVPWGNLYEFLTLSCITALAAAFIVLRSNKLRRLLVFVFIPILILLFIAGSVVYTSAAPLIPALKSYWLVIHVVIISIGSGIFILAGVTSGLYLIRTWIGSKYETRSDLNLYQKILANLPDAIVLNRISYSCVVVAFPIFGIGIISGAIWAERAWGRFWGWDPKETMSLVTWLIYATYLHAHSTAGWRSNRAAYLNLLGFTIMLINLFVINYAIPGKHSYA